MDLICLRNSLDNAMYDSRVVNNDKANNSNVNNAIIDTRCTRKAFDQIRSLAENLGR